MTTMDEKRAKLLHDLRDSAPYDWRHETMMQAADMLEQDAEDAASVAELKKKVEFQERLIKRLTAKLYDTSSEYDELRSRHDQRKQDQTDLLIEMLARQQAGEEWIDTDNFYPGDLFDKVDTEGKVFSVILGGENVVRDAYYDWDDEQFYSLTGMPYEGVRRWKRQSTTQASKDPDLLADLMRKLDPKLFMQQKAWLYRQFCELEPSGPEASDLPEGILNFMDSLQDAAEKQLGMEFPILV